ncbi:hypothetical protein P691DRAFT_804355 [Macrolepiota fuliginosa MF-IS2]|uniref:MYND-type domain-containing protein n=1 Tax=Macrolepiota fuliginosa MF-IS2 TaxID=1400762 RepID=A0A9P5X845_9AGAR|nr:hypothetical protein P691DRAFT_804355 [Macrolepiota fuliginosa MF-IS2]
MSLPDSMISLFNSATTRPDGTKTTLGQQAIEMLRSGGPGFTEVATSDNEQRVIAVPLQKLDRCYVCDKRDGLRLCNSCASAIYCSRECQKRDWREHKLACAQTHQINLKTFHPFIAYMFEYLRARCAPHHDPDSFHPALRRKILKAPIPGPRKSYPTEKPIHHTIVLGDTHDMQDGRGIPAWFRGPGARAMAHEDKMKVYHQVIRELFAFELTVAVSLILLSEVYSTYLVCKDDDYDDEDEEYPDPEPTDPWEPRPCFRLEHGKSPISDFGIAKGRIVGSANRVQTYTYYDPKTDTRTMVHDPDNHYWMYFRTIKGEEITLDCAGSSFGMETYVDASHCLGKLPEVLRIKGSARVPADFRTPGLLDSASAKKQPYTLVEEHRFSVMHNTSLHEALSTTYIRETAHGKAIIREFMDMVLSASTTTPSASSPTSTSIPAPKRCTVEQEERVYWYRVIGSPMLSQILSGRHWLEWGKTSLHHDNLWDILKQDSANGVNGQGSEGTKRGVDEFLKGSRFDPKCKEFLGADAQEGGGPTKGGFEGLWGLVNEGMGLDWSDRCQN